MLCRAEDGSYARWTDRHERGAGRQPQTDRDGCHAAAVRQPWTGDCAAAVTGAAGAGGRHAGRHRRGVSGGRRRQGRRSLRHLVRPGRPHVLYRDGLRDVRPGGSLSRRRRPGRDWRAPCLVHGRGNQGARRCGVRRRGGDAVAANPQGLQSRWRQSAETHLQGGHSRQLRPRRFPDAAVRAAARPEVQPHHRADGARLPARLRILRRLQALCGEVSPQARRQGRCRD